MRFNDPIGQCHELRRDSHESLILSIGVLDSRILHSYLIGAAKWDLSFSWDGAAHRTGYEREPRFRPDQHATWADLSNGRVGDNALPMLGRLGKPWFVYRPTQLLRRVRAGLRPPGPGYVPLMTSWGITVRADPTKMMGHAILTTGVHDLALSEMLVRLIDPGDTVVDVGANIGYTTVLMAVATGLSGRVIAFEPHPELVTILRENVKAARQRAPLGLTEVHELALSDRAGTAELELPSDFTSNDGVARIAPNSGGHTPSLTVPIDTIDNVLRGGAITVLKIDIEGHEAQAFRGGSTMLGSHQIRHVIFEDHDVENSEVVGLLEGHGYRILSFGWSLRGLELAPVRARSLAKTYESPNFVATLLPDDIIERCTARGWRVLSHRFIHRPA